MLHLPCELRCILKVMFKQESESQQEAASSERSISFLTAKTLLLQKANGLEELNHKRKVGETDLDSAPEPSDAIQVETHAVYVQMHQHWRSKICMWMYTVVDHFQFSREIVAIALSIFDRYLFNCYFNNTMPPIDGHSTCTTTLNMPQTSVMTAKNCQLVSVASLHIALKMKEPSGFYYLPTLLKLSRNFFTYEDVTTMELSILESLEWKLCHPTSQDFLDHFMALFAFVLKEDRSAPDAASTAVNKKKNDDKKKNKIAVTIIDKDMIGDIGEFAQYLIELSICDFHCTHQYSRPSLIALACLFNAIDIVLMTTTRTSSSSSTELNSIRRRLKQHAKIVLFDIAEIKYYFVSNDVSMKDILQCQRRIKDIYKNSLQEEQEEEEQQQQEEEEDCRTPSSSSPINVARE